MSHFDFKKRFGKSISPEEAKVEFVNKANYFIIESADREKGYYYGNDGNRMFDFICLQMGKNPTAVIRDVNKSAYSFGYDSPQMPSLKRFTGNDFELTLLMIEVLYEYYARFDFNKDETLKRVNQIVEDLLAQSPISLGVAWVEGRFIPEGAKEIDQKLIHETLHWLKDFPKVKELFENALDHYSQSKNDQIKRKDVITNAQQALDEMTRLILVDGKAFDNSLKELPAALGLGQEWKGLLNQYNEIAKQFGRHPGRGEDYIPGIAETESYLYLTGIMIRLIIQKIQVK